MKLLYKNKFNLLGRHISLDFNRSQTEAMRGLSILLIMLHNFLHLYPSIAQENEFTFNKGRNLFFFARCHEFAHTLPYDILSFLGWYGVPVFIFLSGYGLVKSYGDSTPVNRPFSTGRFLFKNWIKLFRLMIIGVSVFFLGALLTGLFIGDYPSLESISELLIPLTCLNDFIQFKIKTVPGVYWYFGLAFELYLLYALAVRGKPSWILPALTIVCYFSIVIFYTSDNELILISGREINIIEYLRHNFTGWMLPFATGIWCGRLNKIPLWQALLLIGMAIAFFIPSQKYIITWQLAGLWAVIIIIFISLILFKLQYIGKFLTLIGKLSAFIFVTHPIVRHLLNRYYLPINVAGAEPSIGYLLLYATLTIIGAIIYRYLFRLIPSSK